MYKSLLILFMAMAFLGCQTAPQAPASDFSVLEFKFGSVPVNGDESQFVTSTRIANVPGSSYLWLARVKTANTTVHVREELVLPEPSVWSTDRSTTVSFDKRTGVTVRTIEPQGDLVSNGWEIAEGDPSGPYVMRVWIDGQPLPEINFELYSK